MKNNVRTYIVSIFIALAVGGFSALLTGGGTGLYNQVIIPVLSPPSALFPIVWTILFILMGISAAIIYTDKSASPPEKRASLYTYGANLLVNFFWSIIFFNLRLFGLAFFWLLLLLFLIARTIIKYYKINPLAAFLQIPYLLWVAFAGYLTLAIWILNA